MSNFYCDQCGKMIIDTPQGYITGCEHYPLPATRQTMNNLQNHQNRCMQALKHIRKK